MKNEKEPIYQGVSYPSTSSVDVDFSKYYENIEYDQQVVDNIAKTLKETTDKSEAKYLDLIKHIASVIISNRKGVFAIEPCVMMRDWRSFAPCDLDSDDIKFLSEIYTKILPIKLRATVADVLWEATKNNTLTLYRSMICLRVCLYTNYIHPHNSDSRHHNSNP